MGSRARASRCASTPAEAHGVPPWHTRMKITGLCAALASPWHPVGLSFAICTMSPQLLNSNVSQLGDSIFWWLLTAVLMAMSPGGGGCLADRCPSQSRVD